MPVVGGIARPQLVQKGQRRHTRLGAVNLEEGEEQAPAFALLFFAMQFLDEPARGEAGEERQDPAESLVVPRVLAEGAYALEIHGLLRPTAHVFGRGGWEEHTTE